tara:strand:- start:75 stop:647 length:573 start_codon:yes stop_codon:yes gene_type:complete
MPRKANDFPRPKKKIKKEPGTSARSAPTAATAHKTKATVYSGKCQRAAETLASKYAVPPACADVVRAALQAAYTRLVQVKEEPEAKLQMFMTKARSNPEYLQLVTEAENVEEVEVLVHRAMFDRFAYAAPEAQARYDKQVASHIADRTVTEECHTVVANGRLAPMAFQVGKGIGNEHKNKNLDDHRQSCT